MGCISQDKYQETITSVIYNTPNDTGMGKVTSNAAWEVHHISQMHTVDRKVFIGTINNKFQRFIQGMNMLDARAPYGVALTATIIGNNNQHIPGQLRVY